MAEDNKSYYRRRADAEVARVKQSTLQHVAKIHYELAEAYHRIADLPQTDDSKRV